MNNSQKSCKVQAVSYKLELKCPNCLRIRELEGLHTQLKDIDFAGWNFKERVKESTRNLSNLSKLEGFPLTTTYKKLNSYSLKYNFLIKTFWKKKCFRWFLSKWHYKNPFQHYKSNISAKQLKEKMQNFLTFKVDWRKIYFFELVFLTKICAKCIVNLFWGSDNQLSSGIKGTLMQIWKSPYMYAFI